MASVGADDDDDDAMMASAEQSIKAPSIPSVADSQDEDVESCATVFCSVDNDRFEDRSAVTVISTDPGLASDIASGGLGFGDLEREDQPRTIMAS